MIGIPRIRPISCRSALGIEKGYNKNIARIGTHSELLAYAKAYAAQYNEETKIFLKVTFPYNIFKKHKRDDNIDYYRTYCLFNFSQVSNSGL